MVPTPASATSFTDTKPLTTAYQRDSAGRLLIKTLPDGSEITYTYDSLGRLTAKGLIQRTLE